MGDAVGDAKQEGHHGGGHAAQHVGGDDGERVTGGERNGALGDPHQTHGTGGFARFDFRGIEDTQLATEHGGERHAERRRRYGAGHGPHKLGLAGGDHADREQEGHLVDRATHVKAGHAPEHYAQQHQAAAAHGEQHGVQTRHHVGDGGADDEDEDGGDKERTDDGGDQDRHQRLHHLVVVAGRNPAHQITDQEACNDGTDKAGPGIGAVEAAVVGDPAADKARCQCRTITDGVGDVARQNGDHQGEGGHAHVEDLVPHAPCRDLHAARGRIAADGQSQGDQEAPRDHKRDHVGDAVHQITVEIRAAA